LFYDRRKRSVSILALEVSLFESVEAGPGGRINIIVTQAKEPTWVSGFPN
jgi:hypothetical protein